MAQCVNAENIEENVRMEIPEQSVMTGDKHVDRMLYYQLLNSISKAERIDIIVSFLMESGVKMLVKSFRKAVERGVKIRILTGNYLGKKWTKCNLQSMSEFFFNTYNFFIKTIKTSIFLLEKPLK